MKKKIYVFMSFTTYDFSFASSVHHTIEDARKAQMKWIEDTCKFYKIPVPTKDELMEGDNENFMSDKESDYISTYGKDYEDYSTIEPHEIEI